MKFDTIQYAFLSLCIGAMRPVGITDICLSQLDLPWGERILLLKKVTRSRMTSTSSNPKKQLLTHSLGQPKSIPTAPAQMASAAIKK